MSKTDKDRPYRVQYHDPYNRRFRQIGNLCGFDGIEEYTWRKLWPASQCWCCSNRYWDTEKRKRRSGWKRQQENIGSW